ncbi:hypothetical protein GGF46_001223, partial [Coemansia sp. RSA 552]
SMASRREEASFETRKFYEREGSALEGHGRPQHCFTFLEKLGLAQRFRDYMDKTKGVFADIASEAPVYVDGPTLETVQIDWLMDAFDKMEEPDFARRLPVVPTLQVLRGHQHTSGEGTSMDVAGTIYYSGLKESLRTVKMVVEAETSAAEASSSYRSLGRIGYCARKVWEAQPMRTFVPVLFLHGTLMTLIVFARSGYYEVELGMFLHTTRHYDRSNATRIEATFQRLWFLLSLPPNHFGYCVDKVWEELKFNFGGNEALTEVEGVEWMEDETVHLHVPIKREIPLIGRATFLYGADYKGKDAILKLSWTPVSCMPECAIYDVLERGHVTGVPSILRKGIIIEAFWGYRLEFLLMEDCGDRIDDVFRSRRFRDPGELISGVVSEVAACLFHAEKAGVLHRDIAAGNITIDEDGKVAVIDWDSAKLLPSCPFRGDVEQKWGLDVDSILKNEARHNHLTGTPRFMPIRALLGHKERGVYDDIESLFYVACYVLGQPNGGHGKAPGFKQLDNTSMACLRAGILGGRSRHLKRFGVEVCPEGAERCMDALYDILFTDGRSFIGAKLLGGEENAHVVQYDALHVILGDTHFNALFKDSSAERTNLGETSVAAKESTSANACPPARKRSPPPKDVLSPETRKLYEREGRMLKTHGATIPYATLLQKLGLAEAFQTYEEKTQDVFDTLASRAPAYLHGPPSESKQMDWFIEAFKTMEEPSFVARLPVVPSPQALRDHQKRPIIDTNIKPDGVVYHRGMYVSLASVKLLVEAKTSAAEASSSYESLGQIGCYAKAVWNAQPTRTFVPVLFLHGASMTLVVFARSGYYEVKLGNFLRETTDPDDLYAPLIASAFQRLWFLLSLPPSKFGYYVDNLLDTPHLDFIDTETTTKVSIPDIVGEGTVTLGDRIQRGIPLVRRAAYLFNTVHKKRPAILKLSWTPVSRMPEGAVYDVLERGCVDGIPKILRKGIIVPDSWGYRLEYLLMEDCGESIGEYVKNVKPGNLDRLVAQVIRETTACILRAHKAGVLHRDISAGNITIGGGGKVTLIDWGYAKLLPGCPYITKDIEDKWGLNLKETLRNEDEHDHLTGTSQFMPIRVLKGVSGRNFLEDVESLFYVVCFVLCSSGQNTNDSLGFRGFDNSAMAHLRVGLLINKGHHLELFGATNVPGTTRRYLDALYELLFTDDNGLFIGNMLLLDDAEDMRTYKEGPLRTILGNTQYTALFESGASVEPDASGFVAATEPPTLATMDDAAENSMPDVSRDLEVEQGLSSLGIATREPTPSGSIPQIHQSKPSNSAQIGEVAVSADGTPAKKNAVAQAREEQEEFEGARAHYQLEGRMLDGYGKKMGFLEFLEELGSDAEFYDYADQTEGLFAEIALEAPAYPSGPTSEAKQMDWLMEAFDMMERQTFAKRLPVKPTSQRLQDHQHSPIGSTSMKPDGVVYYSGPVPSLASVKLLVEAKTSLAKASSSYESLGQIGCYAKSVWRAQLTRTFVPVLFLHGTLMTLVVFARSGYYEVELGHFIRKTAHPNDLQAASAASAFQRLWFMLSLPPERFGHYVAEVFVGHRLAFIGEETSTEIKVARGVGPETVRVGDAIVREIPLIRRAAYLYRATYKKTHAILKLSWTPVSRMPECAIYDVLERGNVTGIPSILRKGIIVSDFLGYRLEFLLMEDCGKSIEEYARYASPGDLGLMVPRVIQETTACLLHAEKAGVLHRDISAGNITIGEDGKVTLIDWGYAKLLPGCPYITKEIEDKWGLNLKATQKTENKHDYLTGTPRFMPIRVLKGVSGFADLDNDVMAHLRVGLLINKGHHLEPFGATDVPETTRRYLNALYELLFIDGNGSFIGNMLLLDDAEDTRMYKEGPLRTILGNTQYTALFESGASVEPDASGFVVAAELPTLAMMDDAAENFMPDVPDDD